MREAFEIKKKKKKKKKIQGRRLSFR